MRCGFTTLLLVLAGVGQAWGQGACFTFGSDSIGCAPLQVDLVNCAPAGNAVAYNFNFLTDQNNFTPRSTDNGGNVSHTYTTPGVYEIRQLTSGLNFDQLPRRRVHVFAPNSKPIFRLTSCPNLIRLCIEDSVFRQCRVDWASQTMLVNVPRGGTCVDLPTPVSSETTVFLTVTGTSPVGCGDTRDTASILVQPSLPTSVLSSAEGLSTSGTYGVRITYNQIRHIGFKLTVHGLDPIGDVVLQDSTLAVATGTVTSDFAIGDLKKYIIRLEQGIGCVKTAYDSLVGVNPVPNGGTSLAFNPVLPDSGGSSVSRDGQSAIPLLPSDSSYIDTVPFHCNEQRCYTLTTARGPKKYTSYLVCLHGNNGEAANLQLRASRWDAEEKAHTLIFGYQAAVLAFNGEGVETQELFPPTAILTKPVCTSIGFMDSCGHVHADSTFCPFVLSVSIERDVRTVSYELPSGPGLKEDLSLMLIVKGLGGAELGRQAVTTQILHDRSRYPAQHLIYQMIGVPRSHPIDTSLSNPVEIVRKADIVMADAFSPNGDGLNDSLTAETHFIAEATISIFDSWGTPIYKSGLPFAWTGDSPRGKAPAGNYLAIIHAKTQEGETFVNRKWITIAQ